MPATAVLILEAACYGGSTAPTAAPRASTSIAPRVLSLERRLRVDSVEQIHAAGLRVKGLFIFGLPGETPATITATSAFMRSLDLDEMNMSKFSPMYGAPIWDECVAGESRGFILTH